MLSVKSNLDEYKNLLLNKLKDSLEIAGFDIAALERELLKPNTMSHLVMPSRTVAGSMTSYTSFVSEVITKPNLKKKKIQHVRPFVKWAGGKSQLLSELDILNLSLVVGHCFFI